MTYPTRGSGWSGSEASQERQQALDGSGRTRTDEEETLDFLTHGTWDGITQRELQEVLATGHGTASRVLTNLHIAGKVERLDHRRERNHVYVLPEYVGGRTISPYRRQDSRVDLRQRAEQAERDLAVLRQILERHERSAHERVHEALMYLNPARKP